MQNKSGIRSRSCGRGNHKSDKLGSAKVRKWHNRGNNIFWVIAAVLLYYDWYGCCGSWNWERSRAGEDL